MIQVIKWHHKLGLEQLRNERTDLRKEWEKKWKIIYEWIIKQKQSDNVLWGMGGESAKKEIKQEIIKIWEKMSR